MNLQDRNIAVVFIPQMPLAMETCFSMEELTEYTFGKAVLGHGSIDFMARVF
jgi:hypothetical protein